MKNPNSIIINTPDSRITNASWLLISFSIHIFYANRDTGTANEVFFPNQVSLVSIKCNEVLNLR